MDGYSKEIMDRLKAMPIRRWQCSDGCKWLEKEDDDKYACVFWKSVPMTLVGSTQRAGVTFRVPAKRIEGPHTDDPSLECPHYKA